MCVPQSPRYVTVECIYSVQSMETLIYIKSESTLSLSETFSLLRIQYWNPPSAQVKILSLFSRSARDFSREEFRE